MWFNMLSKFLLWLKRIFAKIYESREPPGKTSSHEKPANVPQALQTDQSGLSSTAQTPKEIESPPVERGMDFSEVNRGLIEKERVTEIHRERKESDKRDVEQHEEVETMIDSEIITDTEKGKENEGKTKKSTKPYKRKSPTEEVRERRRDSQEDEGEHKRDAQKREIDLGEIQNRIQSMAKTSRQTAKERQVRKEKENVVLRRVAAPFVELNLIEARVFIVLPEQELKLEEERDDFPQEVQYVVRLNPEEQEISASVVKREDKIAYIEEKRIELKSPFKSFSISFPEELEGRVYSYKHPDDRIYAFVASGNDRARMHYLYDKQGKLNPLPKRDVWILLQEDFLLASEVDVIEEIWVWDIYQPSRLNLLGINEIAIRNGLTNKEETMPCEASFWIEGDGLVEDDFSLQTPIFSGGSIKINSLRQNPSGWTVWVQNKYAGHLVAAERWTGDEPLEMETPNHLPCECGEFQIDVCEKGGGIPVDTLFFRYVPKLQLEYNKDLLLPTSSQGHNSSVVRVFLENMEKTFHLSACNEIKTEGDWHHVEMPPDEDIFKFCIAKKGGQETVATLKVTLPRLKWRVSDKSEWADRLLKIEKRDLVSGTDRYLSVNTNDIRTKYDLLAILAINGLKLQEERFIRKGAVYNVWLNKFHETILKNKGDMSLITEVREKEGQLLGEIGIIRFYEEVGEKPEDTSEKAPEKTLKSLDRHICKKRLEEPKAIMPIVRYGGRMRAGKGFSCGEIIEAGIRVNDRRRLNFRFDKRRKSTYLRNVETLKKLAKVKKNGD